MIALLRRNDRVSYSASAALYERAGASSRTCPSLRVIETCRDFVVIVATQFLFLSCKTRTLHLVTCSSPRVLEGVGGGGWRGVVG